MFWGDASPPRPSGCAWSFSSQALDSQRVPSGACQVQRRPSRSATKRRVAREMYREGVAERGRVSVFGGGVHGGVGVTEMDEAAVGVTAMGATAMGATAAGASGMGVGAMGATAAAASGMCWVSVGF